jgi:2-oxoglutarate ferredoxin oxidoreductase subunit alpha
VKSLHLRADELDAHNRDLQAKYRTITEREIRWAGEHLDDAEVVVVAYGTAARVARTAVARLREAGLATGLFRPVTLWPFPSDEIAGLARLVRGFLVVELSAGQMVEDVRLAVEGRAPVFFEGRMGGVVPTPGDVVDAIRRLYAITPPIEPSTTGGLR